VSSADHTASTPPRPNHSHQTTAPHSVGGFGSYAWALEKQGRLTRREQVREIAAAVRLLARIAPSRVRLRLGLRPRDAFSFDPDALPIPDSAVAREAEQLCTDTFGEEGKPTFANHCFRTYVWGMLLARRDKLRPDAELVYVAAMLHDLALSDRFRDYAPMPCFGARAAMHADAWTAERGWPIDRRAMLADAITLHLNSTVPAERGLEAHLVQGGAGMDVIGARIWELTPQTIDAVLERYPRLGFKGEYGAFRREAHPRTRTELLDRRLKLGLLSRAAPFAE
jgi:hypothetical protein